MEVVHILGKMETSIRDDFRDDQRHGTGTYSSSDGVVVSGNFIGAEITGRGFFQWANGDFYDGEFLNGIFRGEGRSSNHNCQSSQNSFQPPSCY